MSYFFCYTIKENTAVQNLAQDMLNLVDVFQNIIEKFKDNNGDKVHISSVLSFFNC